MATKRMLLTNVFNKSPFSFSSSPTGSYPVFGKPPTAITNCRCNSTPLLIRAYSSTGTVFGGHSHPRKSLDIRIRTLTTTQSVGVAQQQPAQPRSSENPARGDDDAAALQRLKEFQSRQKRLLEEPEPTEPHLIYTGLLTKQMRTLKLFSLSTSMLGLAMQPVLIQQSSEVPVAFTVAMFGMVGFFTIGTPFLIHMIAKKYVTEMLYDPGKDTYRATTFTFFLQKREVSFKIEDILIPDVPGPFTTFNLKNKEGKVSAYFVAPESFLKTSHYGRMMGYDKPIDLRLSVDDKGAKSGNRKSGETSSSNS